VYQGERSTVESLVAYSSLASADHGGAGVPILVKGVDGIISVVVVVGAPYDGVSPNNFNLIVDALEKTVLQQ
jgi:uncharacterized protein (UPF0303 family)